MREMTGLVCEATAKAAAILMSEKVYDEQRVFALHADSATCASLPQDRQKAGVYQLHQQSL
jgi:hypothetical protein